MTSRLARMLRFFSIMFALFACVVASPATAAKVEQIIELKASDGHTVPALITYPEGGADTQTPVAIFHHGGPGGHPLRALGAGRWAATYFSDRGYVTISIFSRIGSAVIDQPFGAGFADIKGAVDWASQFSTGPIILVGHSSGSVSNTLYMARTQDPRVKAIVHFAPTAEGPAWMVRNMGEPRYAAVVARLRRLVAHGHGDQPIYEDHHLAPPAPQTVTYGYLMDARTWLSWWGPDSKDRNIDYFPKIHVPMLMITGDADIFVSRAYQEQLKKAAINSPRVDTVMLDGGVPHEFTGSEGKASKLAFDWLSDIGIRPSPRVSTRVVDLKVGTDIRPGVIYEPTDPALRKPLAVMFIANFADDLLLSPLDVIGPRLAKAGYTVLVPQDRGSGWPFYRSVAADVSTDQQAWRAYLAAQGFAKVAIVADGLAGAMVPPIVKGAPSGSLAGVALIQPPPALPAYAKTVLGTEAYAKAVTDATDAVKRGSGGTSMIIAKYKAPGERKWLIHMATGFLSYWGLEGLAAPVPALASSGSPLLLIDAGQGRFLSRDVEKSLAIGPAISSLWYDRAGTPFDVPDQLAGDLAHWLDGLNQAASQPTTKH